MYSMGNSYVQIVCKFDEGGGFLLCMKWTLCTKAAGAFCCSVEDACPMFRCHIYSRQACYALCCLPSCLYLIRGCQPHDWN
jgi:hypothetical protein